MLNSFSCIEGKRAEFLLKNSVWLFKGFDKWLDCSLLSLLWVTVTKYNTMGKIKIDHKIEQEQKINTHFLHALPSPMLQDQVSSSFPLSLTTGEAHVLGTGLLPHTAGTNHSSKYRYIRLTGGVSIRE